MYPGSSKFIGRPEYTVRKKKLGFIRRSYPDISKLRNNIVELAAKKTLDDPRPQLKKLLKRYPAYPDLRALNAIQIINDASQSGLDHKKTKVIQGSLREISRAIYNGGLNLFNINWFIKIYIQYLDALRAKYIQLYNYSSGNSDREVKRLVARLYRKQIQLTVMSGIKTKLSSLELLNTKLQKSAYYTSSITSHDIKKASFAITNGEPSKKIGNGGRIASNILNIAITLIQLFSRVPILKNLVNSIQNSITDTSRNTVLQKAMVSSTQRLTEFQLQLAGGNREKTMEIAETMIRNQEEIIQKYLNKGVLTKQFEIDPFIKIAWITKESKGLFESEVYQPMLENAFQTVDILFSSRVQIQGAAKIAGNLQEEIQYLLIEAEMLN